jgi:four helix bundle protein
MKNENIKMKNDKEKFKSEFKKRIYRFVLELIAFVDSLPKNDSACRVISEQMIDSGTGIISNYIEAQVASSKKDFTNYFHYCLKCCNETKVWIALF